jgi:hypothetical protein
MYNQNNPSKSNGRVSNGRVSNGRVSNGGVISKTPLKLFEPFSLVVFLSFYSPIILISSLVFLSFSYQNFKGFIYLGFLLACLFAREFIYYISGSNPTIDDGTICTSIQYSKYGNPAFSAFVFAFTIMYLGFPMFSNGAPNFWVFFGMVVYFFLDMGIKLYKNCILHTGDLFLNILLGLTSSALIVVLMYSGGSSKYLFFNQVSSNKDVCSMPSKQTFKCAMYKNGELIKNI